MKIVKKIIGASLLAAFALSLGSCVTKEKSDMKEVKKEAREAASDMERAFSYN